MNLLAMPEHKQQALNELMNIFQLNDDTALKATTLVDPGNPESGWNTEAIENPNPLWKQRGFVSRQEVAEIITANGGTL